MTLYAEQGCLPTETGLETTIKPQSDGKQGCMSFLKTWECPAIQPVCVSSFWMLSASDFAEMVG